MGEKYLVSIIVPIYNAEKYLQRCIDSLLEQTYSPVEIILVDDGSTDDSGKICDEYSNANENIFVLHQDNKGVSSARNAGILNSKGKYIGFVDSDDELLPGAIETLVGDALKYNADIVSATKITIGDDGKTVSRYDDGKIEFYQGTESLKLSLMGNRQTNSSCAKLFRKDFMNGVYFTDGKNINEDGFFLFCCFSQKPYMVQHNVPVYKYFLREGSNSKSQFSEKYLNMLYFCEKKKEIIKNSFPELMPEAEIMETRTNLLFLQILCRTSDKKYRKYEKESIAIVRKNHRNYDALYEREKKFAKIVYYGFYPLYRIMIRIKYAVK